MRSFFKSVLASFTALLLFSGLGIVSLTAIFILSIASASKDVRPDVENNTMLTIDLSIPIQDAQAELSPGEAVQQIFSDQDTTSLSLRLVTGAIAQAAEDPNIVGLYLDGTKGDFSTGLANALEVRRAIDTFRASGKPIIAYDRDWSERALVLGTAATELAIDPLGTVELNGLRAESLFLGGAFEKYGVGVQVVRVGDYKSAVEPLTRKDFSPENREQTTALLNDLWGTFVETIAADRQLDATAIQAITNNTGMLMADEAVSQKLVDRVAYTDEIEARLKELTEVTEADESFREIDPEAYANAIKLHEGDRDTAEIAVIYARGSIVSGEGDGEQIGGDRLAKELRDLRLDDDVKAVVLRVDSPGGSATASEVIKREVALISETKPIVVSMGNVAASGGYWISMVADEIIAEPNTITGSIGVFGLLFNLEQLATNNGATWDGVQTAPFANLDTVSRPKTAAELALIQKFIDRIYNQFVSEVAKGRDLPEAKVREIARGRVWSGAAALENGLVDQLGGLDTAIASAAQRAELENWHVKEYPRTKTLEEKIIERLEGIHLFGSRQAATSEASASAIELEWQRLQTELSDLASFNDPIGAYTRLPQSFEID
jgi:protease-4